jgi:hypothetical protein
MRQRFFVFWLLLMTCCANRPVVSGNAVHPEDVIHKKFQIDKKLEALLNREEVTLRIIDLQVMNGVETSIRVFIDMPEASRTTPISNEYYISSFVVAPPHNSASSYTVRLTPKLNALKSTLLKKKELQITLVAVPLYGDNTIPKIRVADIQLF